MVGFASPTLQAPRSKPGHFDRRALRRERIETESKQHFDCRTGRRSSADIDRIFLRIARQTANLLKSERPAARGRVGREECGGKFHKLDLRPSHLQDLRSKCQTQIEKRQKAVHLRQSVKSLFGLTDDDGAEREEDTPIASKDLAFRSNCFARQDDLTILGEMFDYTLGSNG
jgi:hypothetical protein